MTFWLPKDDLHAITEQESRRLLAARMLPREGPLTDEQRADVLKAVNEHVAKYTIEQRVIAKQCPELGGPPNVCKLLAGDYKHPTTIDEHIRTLNRWLEGDARRRLVRPQNKFVETHVARKLKNAANKAVEARMIIVAYGPTGIGKSMVAEILAEDYVGAVYIRAELENRNWRKFANALAREARVVRKRPKAAGKVSMAESLEDELRGSERLIIVDEAHLLPDLTLEYLRGVFDKCRVPMLWICTIDLAERIKQNVDADHGQLDGRVGWYCNLVFGKDDMPGGKNPLFTPDQIRALYTSDKVRLTDDAVKYLEGCANHLGRGSLRMCNYLVYWAQQIERKNHNLGQQETVTLRAKSLRTAEYKSRECELSRADIDYRDAAMGVRKEKKVSVG